jgi:hypothetical protein
MRLVVGYPGFVAKSGHVGFMVNKVELKTLIGPSQILISTADANVLIFLIL